MYKISYVFLKFLVFYSWLRYHYSLLRDMQGIELTLVTLWLA